MLVNPSSSPLMPRMAYFSHIWQQPQQSDDMVGTPIEIMGESSVSSPRRDRLRWRGFKGHHRMTLVSTACAARNSASRAIRSPHLLISPLRSISPDAKMRAVNPKWATTFDVCLKRVGSSIAVANASAVTGPTPGTLSNSSASVKYSSQRCYSYA